MENIRKNLRNETEDDLMRMFEEFKKSGSKPSATVRRVNTPVKVSSSNSSTTETNNPSEISIKDSDVIIQPPEQKKDVVNLGLNNISSPTTPIQNKPKKKSLFAMRQASGNKLKDVSPFTPKIPKSNIILSKDVIENDTVISSKFSKKRYYDNGFPEVTFDYPKIKDKMELMEKNNITKKMDNNCTCSSEHCECNGEINNSLLNSGKIISIADKEAIHKKYEYNRKYV